MKNSESGHLILKCLVCCQSHIEFEINSDPNFSKKAHPPFQKIYWRKKEKDRETLNSLIQIDNDSEEKNYLFIEILVHKYPTNNYDILTDELGPY
jgi:hypothetical protein